MRPLARRMGRLGTETAFEVLARARALEAQGRHIVHLEIGEPDFDTPRAITAAAIAAIERGETHYTPAAGIIEWRALKGRGARDRAARAPQRHLGALGRDLCGPALRRQAPSDRARGRDARADDRPRRLQQDIRDDRMAPGLRRVPEAARRAGDEA